MEFRIKGKTYVALRLKLRSWLEFEQLQVESTKAIAIKDGKAYARCLIRLVAMASTCPEEEISTAPWYEAIEAINKTILVNQMREIPITQVSSDPNEKKPVWEYEGRTWFWWWHFFAKEYGWNKEQVENLDIDEAISLLQECLLDRQFEREWEYGLSELAYPYDPTTKRGVFKPLSRPDWMTGRQQQALKAMQKVRFKKSMLPVGGIIGEDGNERIVN